MFYRALGVHCDADGLQLAFVEFQEQGGHWSWDLQASKEMSFDPVLRAQLSAAATLGARDYLLLDVSFGRYLARQVNAFIEEQGLDYRVGLVASNGYPALHEPELGLSSQLGSGAVIAAETGLPVVTGIRALDVALGGQGAPMQHVGDRLLFAEGEGKETLVARAGAFKKAINTAILGVLRWREENTTLAEVTGARRDSVGGCMWMGQEA